MGMNTLHLLARVLPSLYMAHVLRSHDCTLVESLVYASLLYRVIHPYIP